MKTFYVLMLVMLSMAEIIFTFFYCYLNRFFDLVPITGGVIYFAAVFCLHKSYKAEEYALKKKEWIDNLLCS